MESRTPGRAAIIGVVLLSALVLVGILVHKYNTVPSGYLAVYSVLGMWTSTLLVIFIAPILIMIPRTRFIGFVLTAAVVFIPCAFFLGIKGSEMAGLNHWRNAEMHQFGPEVPASLVVYYKLGASKTQIDEFERSQLFRSRSDNGGLEFKPGIRRFLRLGPSQAHGHAGFAVDLEGSMQALQRSELTNAISSSPIVFKVYANVAPARIPDPKPGAQQTGNN
ncbi:MAG: hypothetical protein WB987_10935 [Candidatus Acidiferrales bacterium]